jgi:hypothetical protein
MNAETSIPEPEQAAPPQTGLVKRAYGELDDFVMRLAKIESALEDLGKAGGELAEAATRKLRRQIREFEPSVTMIGQVKAGKTTLVNSMIGWPDLLPADINPWTSVVTSLHLEPAARASAKKAKFSFFDEEEWDRLLTKGGRVGELAKRAGADQELEKVRAQLEAMRDKSRQRLGRKFEMLLGQDHEYGYFDDELIQRYVCLGDDFDDHARTDRQQGRFADITKSADLFMGQPEMPTRLCVRDTPGVNDTFMIREQITVNAIRESRLCVVVLSAHQALSTVDMALIRLISNIKSREVIIFVNRIDELADPARDVEEIRESITATLKAHDGPVDAEIVFGSAYWATHALQGNYEELGEASANALINWAEHVFGEDMEATSVEDMVWTLSGVPALCQSIAHRVRSGEGAEFEEKIVRAARNLGNGLSASKNVVSRRIDGGGVKPVARKAIGTELDAIAERNQAALDEQFEDLLNGLDKRLAGAKRTFVTRATAALIKHLDANGEDDVWTYDPAGLRVLLRSGYRVFVTNAQKASENAILRTTSEIRDVYLGAFHIPDGAFALEGPLAPNAPAPVLLGKTIALDIKGSWWSRWWRRKRSQEAYAEEFAGLIEAEIEPVVAALRAELAETYRDTVKDVMHDFVETQRTSLLELADQTEVSIDHLRQRFGESGRQRWELLKSSLSVLSDSEANNEGKVAV